MRAKAVHYTEIVERPVEMEGVKDVTIRWLISEEDDAPNFYMRMFTVQPGGYTPYHSHPYEHEVFVLEGEGIVVIDNKEHRMKGGYVIAVPPDVKHQFKNTGNGILRFLCLIPKR